MKPIDLDLDDYHRAVEAFHNESDRAAAVLAGGFLESYLAKYLRSYMVQDESVTDLFDGFGPFADFKRRYEAAYAFGWINQNQRRDMRFVAKIRNHFAHHPLEAGFDTHPVSQWCAELSTTGIQAANPELHHTNRELYLLAISFCVASMHTSLLQRTKGGG